MSKAMVCLTDLMGALQQINPNDPTAACTGKGVKANLGCLTDFVKKCPQVSQSGAFATVLPHLDQFTSLCGMSGSGSNNRTANCPELSSCNEEIQTLASSTEMTQSGNSTPFSVVPVMVFSLCKVAKKQMQCLDENRAKCPELVKQFEASMEEAISMDKTSPFSYDKVKMMTRDECPNIDAGFSSNKCVRQELESSGFVSCMRQVMPLSAKAARQDQCKFYFDGKACMEEFIGKPCGQRNAKVLVDTFHWIKHDIPEDCEQHHTPGAKTTPNPGNNEKPYATNCPELLSCNDEVKTLSMSAEMEPSGRSTQFSFVPSTVFAVCKVRKKQLQCLDENRAKCPDFVKQQEASVRKSINSKASPFSYDQVRMMIRDECPNICPGFSSNKCVRQELESSGFVSCMREVMLLSAKAARQDQCKFYYDGKACMEKFIGKPCGQAYAKVLVDTAHYVIDDLPKCGSSNIRATVATFMVLLFTFLL